MKPPWFDAVRRWRDELSPATLQERIKDLTARDYWSVYRVTRRRVSEVEASEAYSELAKELLQQPEIVKEMAAWLMSPEAVSAASLLFHLGSNDAKSEALPTVLDWLRGGSGTSLVANYLAGLRKRAGDLPDVATEAIDDAARTRPTDAAHITLLADPSERGLRRLMAILPTLEQEHRGMLRQLSFDPWKELLTAKQKHMLLEQFCAWAKAGDRSAVRTAMDIAGMWRHQATATLPAELVSVLLQLAQLSATTEANVDDHDWKQVMEALVPTAPQQAAELLADEITEVESHRFHRSRYAQEVFRALSKDHPEVAMQAIGKWVLDKRRKTIFRLFEFRGLFDAIGLGTVKPWVEQHGNIAAIGIARHLEGPRVEDGVPRIPELADWLLSTYRHVPDVFREFAMGRHSGEVRAGHARDREAELGKFLSHFQANPKEWVQQWIKYERDSHRRDVDWHDRMDEEDGRM